MDKETLAQETTHEPSFGERMRAQLRSAIAAFFRGLIRLIAILAVLSAIAVLIYFLPRLNWKPSANTQQEQGRLQEMNAQQTAYSEQVGSELDKLRERVHTLELRSDTDKQALDEINAELKNAAKAQQDQLDALTSTQTAARRTIEQINASLEGLDQKITRLENALNQTSSDLNSLDAKVEGLDNQLSSSESPLVAFQRELALIKTMEMLTRGRLYLVQNNLGLAKDEVQAARDLLANLAVPDYQQAALAAMIARLDLALANLPGFPILAAEDLEIAWQLLRAGLPQPVDMTATADQSAIPLEATTTPPPPTQATSEATSTPTDTPEPTPTPTP